MAFLDKENWRQEAESAINDIRKHVKCASISINIENTREHVYINLTTLEELDYCIEMTGYGFRVVGTKYDDNSLTRERTYETPYALLNCISQKYKESFGGELYNRLLELQRTSD